MDISDWIQLTFVRVDETVYTRAPSQVPHLDWTQGRTTFKNKTKALKLHRGSIPSAPTLCKPSTELALFAETRESYLFINLEKMERKVEEILRENATISGPSASFTQSFANNYKWLMEDLRDPRTDNLLFMWSPWPILGCCILYYYVVRVWGPSFMKNRPPYEIKSIMLAYNLFQTLFSAWMFYRTGTFWLTGRYSWVCEPVDYSDSPSALDAMDVTWWYFFSKFIDYTDSIFFVLRKKFDNLSTLHVIHHGIMPFTAWWGIRYVGGGQTMFCGFLNMGIHTIMYFYYFMAALGPQVHKYLWWKKYLTKMQMVQFAAFTLHAIQPIFIDCGFPPFYCFIILGHGAMFFAMFANFYVQAYLKKGAKNKVKDDPKKHEEESENKKAIDSHQRRKNATEYRKTIDVVPT